VNSQSIHDECNAARRKKTRFHGALWLGIGIRPKLSLAYIYAPDMVG
jgi:hypothetical protein